MAVSLSAAYLYQGAKILRNDPWANTIDPAAPHSSGTPEALLAVGRGAYSLGAVAIAPVGIVYNTCMAIWHAFASCCCSSEKATELHSRMWLHLEGASADLMVVLRFAITAALVASFVIPLLFGTFFLPLLSFPLILGAIGFAIPGAHLFEILVLPYHYAIKPLDCFSQLLSFRKYDKKFSQEGEYKAHFAHHTATTAGITTAPLTDEAVVERLADSVFSDSSFEMLAKQGRGINDLTLKDILRALVGQNMIAPSFQGQARAYIDARYST